MGISTCVYCVEWTNKGRGVRWQGICAYSVMLCRKPRMWPCGSEVSSRTPDSQRGKRCIRVLGLRVGCLKSRSVFSWCSCCCSWHPSDWQSLLSLPLHCLLILVSSLCPPCHSPNLHFYSFPPGRLLTSQLVATCLSSLSSTLFYALIAC